MIGPVLPSPQGARSRASVPPTDRSDDGGAAAQGPTAGSSPAAGSASVSAGPSGPGAAPPSGEPIELERQRLARELHDVVGQALTAVRLAIVALGRDGLPEGSRTPLDVCLQQIDEALRAVRSFVRELRPSIVADLGLEAAARSGLARHAALAGFRARIRCAGLEAALPDAVETACYRVLEEALTNIDRHAGARVVDVVLRRSGRWLELVVADDGRGFDVVRATLAAAAGASSGLWGMRARVLAVGGEFDIRSAPNAGTRVRARFPLDGAVAVRSAPGSEDAPSRHPEAFVAPAPKPLARPGAGVGLAAAARHR